MKKNIKWMKKKMPYLKLKAHQYCALCICDMADTPRNCHKWNGCYDHWKNGFELATIQMIKEGKG